MSLRETLPHSRMYHSLMTSPLLLKQIPILVFLPKVHLDSTLTGTLTGTSSTTGCSSAHLAAVLKAWQSRGLTTDSN